jgi:hypothetical protein
MSIIWALLRFVGAVVLAVVLGLASAYYAAFNMPSGNGAVVNGPWTTNLTTGGTNADMYTRAFVALTGLLALNKDETIYFNATADSAGEALAGNCSYRIEGTDPDTRWWSITAYAKDNFLIDSPSHRYAISKTDITRSQDGTFVIRVSTIEEATNWIAASPDGFQLTLRLYNPGRPIKEYPGTTPLPSIVKEACS